MNERERPSERNRSRTRAQNRQHLQCPGLVFVQKICELVAQVELTTVHLLDTNGDVEWNHGILFVFALFTVFAFVINAIIAIALDFGFNFASSVSRTAFLFALLVRIVRLNGAALL